MGSSNKRRSLRKSTASPVAITIILVGNKIDDEKNRKVTTEEGENMAKECGLDFFEISEKCGVNIDNTFNELVKKTV